MPKDPAPSIIRRPAIDQLEQLPVTYESVIDEEYVDSNGHMNVAWYLHLFNKATGGLHRWLGFDWPQLKAGGVSSFVLEGHIRYLAEVFEGQQVTLRSRLIARSARRLQYLHFMFNEDKRTLAATYEEVLAHMDMKTRRMKEYAPSLAAQLDRGLAEHQTLSWEPPICGSLRV